MTDDAGVTRTTVFCDVFRDTNTYAEPDPSSERESGHLPVGAHWFACQRQGKENPTTYNRDGALNHNVWWLWTKGEGDRAWGWIPATFVVQSGDNEAVRGVPFC